MIPGRARQGFAVVRRRPSCGLGRQFLGVALEPDLGLSTIFSVLRTESNSPRHSEPGTSPTT
jgi:hypothetical protein